MEVCRYNITQSELQKVVQRIKEDLLVDKTVLSATIRKKVGGALALH